MHVLDFLQCLCSDFYVGVPDSQLKAICNYLIYNYGITNKHIIAANEGNCVGIAAGYYMATGKIPVVYLQNSGIGNIINPVASLLNEQIYGIPCIFIIGWRGEPGIHDEPQHKFQGEITLNLLEDIGIACYVVSKETSLQQIEEQMEKYKRSLDIGKSVAFIIKKDTLEYSEKVIYKNKFKLNREKVIEKIVDYAGTDIIVSTTGKTSRELFEIRERKKVSHQYDFLTVGSMGHSSSIAFGIAVNRPEQKVWCIDGDGAALMHMGAMAVIGSNSPKNMVHIVINNGAHESVGGIPTVATKIDFIQIASACGYPSVFHVKTMDELECALKIAKKIDKLHFIEVKTAIGAREDLGRPTLSTKENKENFMKYLRKTE
ncbi:MAG: phosphonopyruvate decarboxylase [Lachnospiraceae bacterium]|nr:phosphonopyruvate decarboxylase [Lachnospiraceae bacterium]